MISSFLERFVFKYYSSGYNYIIPALVLNWVDSRRYCLTLGTDLPVLWDVHTDKAIDRMLARAGVSNEINIGLQWHPVTSEFEWVDGSPFVYMHWNGAKPDGGECASRFSDTTWDSLNCDDHVRQVMCQQSIEGMENIVCFCSNCFVMISRPFSTVQLILVPRALLTRGATRGSGQIHIPNWHLIG